MSESVCEITRECVRACVYVWEGLLCLCVHMRVQVQSGKHQRDRGKEKNVRQEDHSLLLSYLEELDVNALRLGGKAACADLVTPAAVANKSALEVN